LHCPASDLTTDEISDNCKFRSLERRCSSLTYGSYTGSERVLRINRQIQGRGAERILRPRCSSPTIYGRRSPPPATKPNQIRPQKKTMRANQREGARADLREMGIGDGGRREGARTLSPAKAPATTKVT
jgi:hypothetical protein